MTTRDAYPPGTPGWVDTLQPDPVAARSFYGALFGWKFDEGAGDYSTAWMGGRRVAGLAEAPEAPQAAWRTCVCVEDVEATLVAAEAAGGARLSEPVGSGMLTDVTGVPFGLCEGGGAELVDEPGAWQMSSLHTTDLKLAEAFYGDVFGWVLERGEPFSTWRLDDQVVAVVSVTDGVAVPPHWAVNFCVSDADAAAEHATVLGGTALMSPFDTPGFRNAVLADPQGGVFAVSELVLTRGQQSP